MPLSRADGGDPAGAHGVAVVLVLGIAEGGEDDGADACNRGVADRPGPLAGRVGLTPRGRWSCRSARENAILASMGEGAAVAAVRGSAPSSASRDARACYIADPDLSEAAANLDGPWLQTPRAEKRAVSTHAELATIRKLSQYRPFERGGRDAAEAQEDMLLAALAEGGGAIESIKACRAAISTLFKLEFDEIEISRALNGLLNSGMVLRDGPSFALAENERERLETIARESESTAARAMAEWLGLVAEQYPGLSDDDERYLREDLDAYLRMVIQRHGAEAALLLYPDDAHAQRLYEDLEDLGFDFLEHRSARLHKIRGFGLSQFMRSPTEAQRAFLSQNLSTGYFWTVLSIDPEGARLVQKIAKGQRVYLDTNFIFRLLGIQGPRYIRPAQILLDRTQGAGYETCVTPWTVDELRGRLRSSREFLKSYPVPPSEYASLAADATSDDDFVTFYWRRVREEPGLKVDDFLAYYEEVEDHLAAMEVPVRSEGCQAVDRRHQDIADEVALLERATHGGRQRALRTLQHDVKHRLLIEQRRGDANRSFATAGAWFLTHDSVLPRYDNLARKGSSDLPFCVSAGSWFQVVEAFNPKSGDLGQTLADMLASPYVRYRRTLSKEGAQAIVARTSLHTSGTPDLAARVFMNSAAVEEIEAATGAADQLEKIDNALIAAALEVQEEAHLAKAQADSARERARLAEAAAEEKGRQAERDQISAIERERALRDEAVRAEVARGEEAVKNEAARALDQIASTEARYRAEVDAANRRTARESALRQRTGRRVRLGTATLISLLLLLVLGLSFGLDAAWSYVVGAGVLFGIGAAADQFLGRNDDISLEEPPPSAPDEV